MAHKVILKDFASLANHVSATNQLNENNSRIEDALEKTLSRDGTQPNAMTANLDMNSQRILNLPEPVTATEPLRLGDEQIIIDIVDDGVSSALTAHIDDTTGAHAASAISFSPTGSISSIDVQSAIAEVASEAGGNPTAADVAFTPTGGLAANDVQEALEELDTEKLASASYTAADVLTKLLTVDGAGSTLDADLLDGQSSAFYATASSVSDHLADAADAHDASAISVLDAGGNYTATDAEAALAEVFDATEVSSVTAV